MKKYRDIGANLANKVFDKDINEVIDRAFAADVATIDVTGTDLDSSKKALTIASKYPGQLFSTAGIHPHAAKEFNNQTQNELIKLLESPLTSMCGEMGLDYDRNYSTPEQQKYAFYAQLELAEQINKPLFLHNRGAFKDFTTIMDKHYLWQRSIVHCFTGTKDEAQAYLDRQSYIGITGWLLDDRRNQSLLNALEVIPLDRIFLETDAPYLMPSNNSKTRRRRNEPVNLPLIAARLAEIYSTTIENIQEATESNLDNIQTLQRTDEQNKTPTKSLR
jgi:TatD DNase family protein